MTGSEKNHIRNIPNLRIVIEPIFVQFGGHAGYHPNYMFISPIILDPRHLDDKGLQEAIAFHKPDAVAKTISKHIELAGVLHNRNAIADLIYSVLPDADTNVEQLINDIVASKAIDMPDIISRGIKQCSAPVTQESLKSGLPNFLENVNDKIAYALYENTRLNNDYAPPEVSGHAMRMCELLPLIKARLNAESSAIEQMHKDEKQIAKLFLRVPQHLKNALNNEPTTILLSSMFHAHGNGHGNALCEHSALTLDRETLKKPEFALKVLQEEILHLLDHRLRFSESAEWQVAARKEITSLDQDKMDLIENALGGRKQNAYTAREGDYSLESVKFAELLVDYFHVKYYFEKQWTEQHHAPPTKDELNTKMQEMFPNIFPLCRKFEREILELGRGNSLNSP